MGGESSVVPVRDPFADDVLGRLIKSNPDYQRTHGHYIVPLAQRLLDARDDLADERGMAKQVIETLRNLHDNWRNIIDEKDDDGGPLIENLLYWAIDDLGGATPDQPTNPPTDGPT